MTAAEKKKLMLAGGIFGAAAAVAIWYAFAAGRGPSKVDQAAQQSVLDQMGAAPASAVSSPEAPAPATNEPAAGRPRSVSPGT